MLPQMKEWSPYVLRSHLVKTPATADQVRWPMVKVRQPTREFRRAIEDSLRWRNFEHRPDDIFISTPPKSGTTWMQGIVSSLLWPAGNAPDDGRGRSPWIDARFVPLDDLLAQLDAQEHRRYIKTHSPADCVPIFEECKYITVYRDGRDALMSWANHRGAMRSELVDFLNASALDEGLLRCRRGTVIWTNCSINGRPTVPRSPIWRRGGPYGKRVSPSSCTTTI